MTYIPKKNRQTIPITDKGKTKGNTKVNTTNKPKSVSVKGDTGQSFIREKKDDYFHSTKRSVDEDFRKAIYISLQDKIFKIGILDSNDLYRLKSGFIEFYISLCFENSSFDMYEKIRKKIEGLQGKINKLIKYENITEKSIVILSLHLYEIYCCKSYWRLVGVEPLTAI